MSFIKDRKRKGKKIQSRRKVNARDKRSNTHPEGEKGRGRERERDTERKGGREGGGMKGKIGWEREERDIGGHTMGRREEGKRGRENVLLFFTCYFLSSLLF